MNLPNDLGQSPPVTGETEWPSIAVVIPCWNAEKWIARAIQSVLDQNYPNLEIIVIDDGSTDGSLEIIKSFGDKIRWETGPNRGACVARNRGLKLDSSEYVMFLDADDYIEGDLIRGALEAATASNAELVLCRMAIEFPDGHRRVYDHFQGHPNPLDVFENWLIEKSVGPCSILWSTSFAKKIGGWSEDLTKFQDGELVLRALTHEPRITASSRGVGVYNAHAFPSLSKQRDQKSVWSEFISIDRLRNAARGGPFEDRCRGFSGRYYLVAQAAFLIGDVGLGDRSLSIARILGLRGYPGTTAHRFCCHLIGLKYKTFLARWLRNVLGKNVHMSRS